MTERLYLLCALNSKAKRFNVIALRSVVILKAKRGALYGSHMQRIALT